MPGNSADKRPHLVNRASPINATVSIISRRSVFAYASAKVLSTS